MVKENKQNESLSHKRISEKEANRKIKDLKIELLKSPTKRGRVKKEIARLLTMSNVKNNNSPSDDKITKNKSTEGKK